MRAGDGARHRAVEGLSATRTGRVRSRRRAMETGSVVIGRARGVTRIARDAVRARASRAVREACMGAGRWKQALGQVEGKRG